MPKMKFERSGFMDTNGNFFPCPAQCHAEEGVNLAARFRIPLSAEDSIDPQDGLLRAGWLKVSYHRWYRMDSLGVTVPVESMEGLTQRQLDAVFDFCEALDKPLPWRPAKLPQ